MPEHTLQSKYVALQEILRKLGSAVVAFSGGVDSTLLLKVALDVMGRENVLAATAQSPTFPASELETSRRLAGLLGANHRVLRTNELQDKDFAGNPPDRCYHCKRELLGPLQAIARQEGLEHVLEGSNLDDAQDGFRPGMRAVRELGVRSPLREAGLVKADVRALSARLGLPTHDKPSQACLASRIPYGEPITEEKLKRIERAEEMLRQSGFGQLRVRSHGTTARIELGRDEDLSRLLEDETRRSVVAGLKKLGFIYVTVDLEGYRTGSMNAPLARRSRGRGGRPSGGRRCTAKR